MNEDITQNKGCVHEGHRSRMEGKVLSGHVSSMTDVELLEMLLYNVIRRQNTNEIAHGLIDRFGSLGALFDAEPSAVKEVFGTGHKTAVFLAVTGEIYKRASRENGNAPKSFAQVEDIGQYFINVFRRETEESVKLLMLDGKNRFVDCQTVHEGTVSSSSVSARRVIKAALDSRASRVVIAHNHPFGDPSPSDDDIVLTRIIRRALSEIDVDVVEHILVADDRYMPLIAYMNKAAELTYEN